MKLVPWMMWLAAFGLAATQSAAGWVPGPALPTPRANAVGVQKSGFVYALGGPPWSNGGDQDGAAARSSGASWAQTSPFHGIGPALGQGAGVDSMGRIVVFGGVIDGSDPGPTFVYDAIDGPTTSLPNRASSAPNLGFSFATDAEGRIYSLGGGPGGGGSNTGFSQRYDATTNSWQTIAAMPTPAAFACAAADSNGHVLVIGGINAQGTARIANVARYDIASGTWSDTALPDLPTPLSHARAAMGIDQRIYVIGGRTGSLANGAVSNATYVLDAQGTAWTTGSSLTTGRVDFAMAPLGHDLWIAGGVDAAGASLSSVETLYTPECPSIQLQPAGTIAWVGLPTSCTVIASGGSPLSYQWRHNGVPLIGGIQSDGSAIAGTTSNALTITFADDTDHGTFDAIVTTPCGSVATVGVQFEVHALPVLPSSWSVHLLHPTWANASRLNSVSGGIQVGAIDLPFESFASIERPTIWRGTAASAQLATPAGSAGGSVQAAEGDLIAGWWWWPYSCYYAGTWYTCYSMEAAQWSATTLEHTNLQISGWEFSQVTALGSGVGAGMKSGYVWTDDFGPDTYDYKAMLWLPPDNHSVPMNPAGVWRSIIQAADGASQFGWVFLDGSYSAHAAAWSGSAESFIDLNPPSALRSLLYGAGGGQQVGITGSVSNTHAGVWAGSPASFRDLHPADATSSTAAACAGGVQAGTVSSAAGSHAIVWSGTPESAVDLHASLPGNYASSSASGMSVDATGLITVVGSAYNATAGREEAVMWTSRSTLPGDLTGDGHVDGADLGMLLAAWGSADIHADLNHDGTVDGADLGMLLAAWG